MFRPSARLFQRATFKDANLLELLIPACKTMESASQELKWIKNELPKQQWLQACKQRSELVPLQYILGTQPFGHLEIKCRKNVLIPRWETEEWSHLLVESVKNIKNLKVLDVCTGTGCIPLLMADLIPHSQIKGIDISQDALDLALENKTSLGISNVEFVKGDVFDENILDGTKFDLITANPPYVTEKSYYSKDTEESVRIYEPKLALIGDTEFYKALIENVVKPSGADGFIFELAEENQVQTTKKLLNSNWKVTTFTDSNGKLRCVFGYKVGSQMQIQGNLKSLG